MRLHVVSLPHTETTRAYDWCAYTAKVRRFGTMLAAHGHEMVLYAGERNEAECIEHVTVTDVEKHFGGPWPAEKVFDRWEPLDPAWTDMAARAISEIQQRIQPGDAIGLIAGRAQASIAAFFAAQGYRILEWGVGYVGVLPDSYRAFESAAHRAYVSGWHHDDQGRPLDTVIPNAFDPADLLIEEPDDYLLYLGRMTARKGMSTVAEFANRFRVVTAGPDDVRIEGAEHRGVVVGDEKAKLLARARALLVPTQYLEPFGGVAVEGMMSGVPVICTDFGAFPETVQHGRDGYRCSTLDEFLAAPALCDQIDRDDLAARARARYSLTAVAALYDRWLMRTENR